MTAAHGRLPEGRARKKLSIVNARRMGSANRGAGTNFFRRGRVTHALSVNQFTYKYLPPRDHWLLVNHSHHYRAQPAPQEAAMSRCMKRIRIGILFGFNSILALTAAGTSHAYADTDWHIDSETDELRYDKLVPKSDFERAQSVGSTPGQITNVVAATVTSTIEFGAEWSSPEQWFGSLSLKINWSYSQSFTDQTNYTYPIPST
jgi:hypothetical protein